MIRGLIGILLTLPLALAGCGPASNGPKPVDQQPAQETPAMSSPVRRVEAACGECQFGLPGSGCDLAVRIDGVAYFVDGTSIDDHGDAHAQDGFCNAIRFADVEPDRADGHAMAKRQGLCGGGSVRAVGKTRQSIPGARLGVS